VQHFEKMLAWRRSFGADSILQQQQQQQQPPTMLDMQAVMPFAAHGARANNGGVIYIERVGAIDPWKATNFSADDLARYVDSA
jgi:hypothetical protein